MNMETMRVIEGDLRSWRSISGMEGLAPVFEYLERTDLSALPVGRTVIDGDDVFALVSEYKTRDAQEVPFEAHRRFLDVQYAIDGQESIGFAPLGALQTTTPYDDTKDIEFFASPDGVSSVALRTGRFAVFAPEDGHQPGCHLEGPHSMRKLVVKVSVAYRDRNRAKSSGRR